MTRETALKEIAVIFSAMILIGCGQAQEEKHTVGPDSGVKDPMGNSSQGTPLSSTQQFPGIPADLQQKAKDAKQKGVACFIWLEREGPFRMSRKGPVEIPIRFHFLNGQPVSFLIETAFPSKNNEGKLVMEKQVTGFVSGLNTAHKPSGAEKAIVSRRVYKKIQGASKGTVRLITQYDGPAISNGLEVDLVF